MTTTIIERQPGQPRPAEEEDQSAKQYPDPDRRVFQDSENHRLSSFGQFLLGSLKLTSRQRAVPFALRNETRNFFC